MAKVLAEQVFCRFGTPVSVLSNRGKKVDGNISVSRMMKIHNLRTTPYKPSTNQEERLHRTINSVLRKTFAENQRHWDIRLSFVMAAYSASRCEPTGTSNTLRLGREVRMPAYIVYGPPDQPQKESYDNFVLGVRSRMTEAFEKPE